MGNSFGYGWVLFNNKQLDTHLTKFLLAEIDKSPSDDSLAFKPPYSFEDLK